MQPAVLPFPSCTAILVAAGASRRMGMDKLAWPLAGVPVLRRALEAFLAADSIAAVVVVCPQDRWKLLGGGDFCKPVMRVDGGANRQDSVACGLAALDPNTRYVAVHDAARPLIAPLDIDRCVAAAIEYGAATLARRVTESMQRSDAHDSRRATETMQRSDDQDFDVEVVSRKYLWCMETPQVFETALLRDAYTTVAASGLLVTDEVSAVQLIGARVKFVESRHPNLKITTAADLALAAALLEQDPTP
ncbi:MAG: IspD/TarI family cytidylyltransferase [Verrucomicrobia bacterium]|nr:IspD/TarI family cytidylyltransferase [Verrucomicrobiota bacterium]